MNKDCLLMEGDYIRIDRGMEISALIPKNTSKLCTDPRIPFTGDETYRQNIVVGEIYSRGPFSADDLVEKIQGIMGHTVSRKKVKDFVDSCNLDFGIRSFDTSVYEGEYYVFKAGLDHHTKAFFWPVWCYKVDDPSKVIGFEQKHVQSRPEGLPYMPILKPLNY